MDKDTGCTRRIKSENFPPPWVQQRLKTNSNYRVNLRGVVPYLDMLTDYYIVIKRFVDNLWLNGIQVSNHNESLLEKDIAFQFIKQIETHGMPGISKIDPRIVLATLIWTSSVVHAADHITYTKMSRTYGFYNSPIEWNSPKVRTWKDVIQGNWKKCQWEAFRTQCFLDLFVTYNKSWFWPHDRLTSKNLYKRFKTVLYPKKRQKANQIHDLFREELYYVNNQWYWALDVDTIPASTCF